MLACVVKVGKVYFDVPDDATELEKQLLARKAIKEAVVESVNALQVEFDDDDMPF